SIYAEAHIGCAARSQWCWEPAPRPGRWLPAPLAGRRSRARLLGNILAGRRCNKEGKMRANIPRVSEGSVYDPRQVGTAIRLDSTAWFAWLAVPTTTSFSYPLYDPARGYIVGFMTVRKEQRQRGGMYWTVFRRCRGRVRKIYLGHSTRV